ncbi:RNA 2',3'-cyclic phosphodiesterase [Desulfomarina sp.]
MKRIFIAVDLPENIRKGLTGLGSSLPRARTVPPDQLHLTVKFIGEVEGGILLDIQECLQETALKQTGFAIRLKGVGVFPPRSTPRVLWAGVKPKEPLTLLRNRMERTLKKIGVPEENRKYSPHITLARLKNCPIQRLQQFLAANSFLESPEFSVNGFSLYSSRLTPKGAIHTLLQRYDFK